MMNKIDINNDQIFFRSDFFYYDRNFAEKKGPRTFYMKKSFGQIG